MTHIELMTWLILSLEVSAGLLVALIALGVWTWRRHSRLSGTVDRLVGQIERAQKLRGGEIAGLLGERCPAEALEQAVQACLDRERALLMAVAESLRQRGDTDAGKVPSAVQALTEAAVGAGQRSVPPEDPNPALLEQNAELRESRDGLAGQLAQTREAQDSLATQLAETREAFDVLDQEYRAAFERQAQDTRLERPAVPPLREVPATQASASAEPPAVVTPMTRSSPPVALLAPNLPEAVAVAMDESPSVPGADGPLQAAATDVAWPPPDMDLDGLVAELDALGDLEIATADTTADAAGALPPDVELIRIDEDEPGEPLAAPRAAAR